MACPFPQSVNLLSVSFVSLFLVQIGTTVSDPALASEEFDRFINRHCVRCHNPKAPSESSPTEFDRINDIALTTLHQRLRATPLDYLLASSLKKQRRQNSSKGSCRRRRKKEWTVRVCSLGEKFPLEKISLGENK